MTKILDESLLKLLNQMKLLNYLSLTMLFTFVSTTLYAQKTFTLESPQQSTSVTICVGDQITYQVTHESEVIIENSPISLTIDNGDIWGVNSKFKNKSTASVNEVIKATIYKKSEIQNIYNELTLRFKDDFNLIFRSYDDGVAYRFVYTGTKPLNVVSEQASFNFAQNYPSYICYVKGEDGKRSTDEQFMNSFENQYTYSPISDWKDSHLAVLPILLERENGKKISITEVDLFDYPGMYLHKKKGTKNSLDGVFAPYPKEMHAGGHNNLEEVITSREDYIAKLDAMETMPWRVIIVSNKDAELANNDMVYKLAKPASGDFSWVEPGKVAWDWWNDWSLYGVDFEAGINNQTYKHYIDFASENSIEYVILDEGWTKHLTSDLMQVIPEIDIKELVDYAEAKNVGIILWAGYNALAKDIEGVCKYYSEMGVKGFKVDFMDRDDQLMVHFVHRTAQIATNHKLLIDYHGTYKPTGLHRTYPNVINFEGVHGLEQMKWSDNTDQVVYDVTIPFIRQIAGPMDYTQGAMRNASKSSYKPNYSEPTSQGTRCHQLAQYVIFESPLNMLCDSPSNYTSEQESLKFIAEIPTVWDQTIVLNGEVAEFVTIARFRNGEWYVGSMTNWTPRQMELDLSFLGEGEFIAELFVDGPNASKTAKDYQKRVIEIPADRKLKISLAAGGGSAMKIVKK